MKSLIVLLFLLNSGWASAIEYNKRPEMPPSTEEFETQMAVELNFIRLCAYLTLTQRDPNPDNCDQALKNAMLLLQRELQNLKFSFQSQIRSAPFFKYGDIVIGKVTAETFKQAWRNYFYTIQKYGGEVIQATAGLKRTHALDGLEGAFFVMSYEATAALAAVRVHVKQPRWIRWGSSYPEISPLIHHSELAGVYTTLDHLNVYPSPYPYNREAEVKSMKDFLIASGTVGVQGLTPKNIWQFLMLREFWQEKIIPEADIELISAIETWPQTVAYRAHMGVEGCEQLLQNLELEKRANGEPDDVPWF